MLIGPRWIGTQSLSSNSSDGSKSSAAAAAGAMQREAQHREQCLPQPHPVFASPPKYEIIESASSTVNASANTAAAWRPREESRDGDDDEDRHQHDRAEHPTHGDEAAVAELIHPDRDARQQVADALEEGPGPGREAPRGEIPARDHEHRQRENDHGGSGKDRDAAARHGFGRRQHQEKRSAVAEVDAADAGRARRATTPAISPALSAPASPADQRARADHERASR